MELYKVSGCCGVREIHGVSGYGRYRSNWDIFFEAFATNCAIDNRSRDNFAHAFFTAAEETYGDELRDQIHSLGFGTVMESPWSLNPNSGNDVKMYMWTIDWKAFRAAYPRRGNAGSSFSNYSWNE